MENQKFIDLCREKVAQYYNEKKEKTDATPQMEPEDVFVVWSCQALQNNKALMSTPVSDGMYYELTFNGDRNELYFGAYKKWENICMNLTEE